MLAGHTHTFLCIYGAPVWTKVGSQENVFELHHTGVSEQQRLIASWNQR
jgi:hypothetical protein